MGGAGVFRLGRFPAPRGLVLALAAVAFIGIQVLAYLGSSRVSHAGHDHGDVAPYPSLAGASPADRARAGRLWHATLAAGDRFATSRQLRQLGFKTRYGEVYRYGPHLFHWRKDAYTLDKTELDPARPESVVYWMPARGKPREVGLMFRAPRKGKPPSWGGILHWHVHAAGSSQMLHVWLTHDMRSAYARCIPFRQLHLNPRGGRFSHHAENQPCPAK